MKKIVEVVKGNIIREKEQHVWEKKFIFDQKNITRERITKYLLGSKNQFDLSTRPNFKKESKDHAEYANVIFAKAGEDDIGYIAFYTNLKKAFIPLLVVKEAYQGQGVATKLLDMCEAETSKLGFDSIYLQVYKSNSVAVAMYTKRGYKPSEDKDEVFIMRKYILKIEKIWGFGRFIRGTT